MKREPIEEALRTIKKKGDILDVIAKRKNKYLKRKFFLNISILVLSRIGYGLVYFARKYKSMMAPLVKVKKAEEIIRNHFGFPVDIVRSKIKFDYGFDEFINNTFSNYYLSILYENEEVNRDTYINQLKKISEFINQYKLKSAVLYLDDLLKINPNIKSCKIDEDFDGFHIDIDLKDAEYIFRYTTLKNLLGIINLEDELGIINLKDETTNNPDDINDMILTKLNKNVIVLDYEELLLLISYLNDFNFDKNFLIQISNNVQDYVVKKAIGDFTKDNDLRKLKNLVKSRLTLNINSNNSYKDKLYGKVIKNAEIYDKYLKLTIKNAQGELIKREVITLYNYLEVYNFENILKKLETKQDNKELLNIAAIYLYLIDSKNIDYKNTSDYKSIYDYYFEAYKLKKAKKINNIAGLYCHFSKFLNLLTLGIVEVIAFLFVYSLISFTIDKSPIKKLFITDEHSNTKEEVDEFVKNILTDSLDFEISLLKSTFRGIENGCDKLAEYLGLDGIFDEDEKTNSLDNQNEDNWFFSNTFYTGDDDAKNKSPFAIAYVTELEDNITLPNYYATSWAVDFNYLEDEGKIEILKSGKCMFSIKLEDVKPLFQISHELPKDYLDFVLIVDADFCNTFYPVGDNYVLNEFKIVDQIDDTRVFTWDLERAKESGLLTDNEKELLKNMEYPEIIYTYGISKESKNSFVSSFYKLIYTNLPIDSVKAAISRGLGLDSNATNEEMFSAIKNKYYSTTPIKDAGLNKKIKKLNELEYYETIASLDSLICNLAANLAVMIDDELYYVTGYLSQDGIIYPKDSHAWAMDADGNIIDLTPSELSENKKVEDYILNLFEFFGEKKFLVILPMLLGLLAKILTRDKIVFLINMKKAEFLLKNNKLNERYALLFDILYGGINLVGERSPYEFAQTIKEEFFAYSTKEDLQELKKYLKKAKACNYFELRSLNNIINEIPFIIENNDELKRRLEKK